jgi:hypothetical protein
VNLCYSRRRIQVRFIQPDCTSVQRGSRRRSCQGRALEWSKLCGQWNEKPDQVVLFGIRNDKPQYPAVLVHLANQLYRGNDSTDYLLSIYEYGRTSRDLPPSMWLAIQRVMASTGNSFGSRNHLGWHTRCGPHCHPRSVISITPVFAKPVHDVTIRPS